MHLVSNPVSSPVNSPARNLLRSLVSNQISNLISYPVRQRRHSKGIPSQTNLLPTTSLRTKRRT
jgi:hypothetical protein